MVSTLKAGQPYIVYVGSSSNDNTSISNASIKPILNGNEDIQTKISVITFQGTYTPIVAPGMEGKYGVTTQGRIQKGSVNASLRGFRAYFELSDEIQGEVKALTFDNEQATGIDVIETVTNPNAFIYDVSGRRVGAKQKGLLIVDGQKKLFK